MLYKILDDPKPDAVHQAGSLGTSQQPCYLGRLSLHSTNTGSQNKNGDTPSTRACCNWTGGNGFKLNEGRLRSYKEETFSQF